jgi:hypothetical protein
LDWTRDPAEIPALIDRYRADQRALVEIIEEASAVIDRCRALITADAHEIDTLRADHPNVDTLSEHVYPPSVIHP